jgi:MFS family permease
VLGGLTAILGLVGLFVAARSGVYRPVGYYGGLISFAIGVLIVFYLEKLAFDEAEKRKHGPTEAPALERWRSRPDIEVRRTTKHVVALALILVAVGSVVFHFLSPWWWTPIASNWGYVDDTIIITFWITGVVFIGIIAFMAYCVFRYRHREGRRAAYEPENKKLEWWLTIGTTVGVAGMLAPGLFVWDQSRPNTQAARGGPAMTCTFHSVITPDGDLWRACWRAMEPSLVAKREKRL